MGFPASLLLLLWVGEGGKDLTISIKGAYVRPELLTTGVCILDSLGGSSEHRVEYLSYIGSY